MSIKLTSCFALCTFMAMASWAVADEAEVRQFLRDYTDAFNQQNLEAALGMWTETAVHVDREAGSQTEGREAIKKDLERVFRSPVKTHIAGNVERVRVIKPDVMSVWGTVTTTVPDEDPDVSEYSAIIVKQNGRWQIDSVEESAVTLPASAHDALVGLEWLVGDWLDESENSQVISSYRWSDSGSFLVRTIAEQSEGQVTRAGTQIIGWDPRSKQIRSWTFNADGSFGDGVWSKHEDEWHVKSSQTLADGGAASGTYVITPIDADTVTMRLIGQEVEGESLPTSDAVTIVRLPKRDEATSDTAQAN